MNFELKYIFFIYIFFLILLYIWKPNMFVLSESEPERKRKILYLCALIIIIAIISFYIKVLVDWFL
jgi:uncharacterized membrane protein